MGLLVGQTGVFGRSYLSAMVQYMDSFVYLDSGESGAFRRQAVRGYKMTFGEDAWHVTHHPKPQTLTFQARDMEPQAVIPNPFEPQTEHASNGTAPQTA